MKKIISLLTLAAMCFGLCFSTSTAASESLQLTADQLQLLSFIGVVDESELTNEILAGDITRAQFLMYAARTVGVPESIEAGNNYYTDMIGHWANGLASHFVERGVLTVGDSKLFEPERPILAEEALKIVLSVLGYNKVAEPTGGFPTGYVKTANRVDLSVPQINTNLTLSQALSLLAEGVEIVCYEPTVFSADGYIDYTTEYNETLLSMYHSIYSDEGYVRATNTISLDGTVCDEGEMVIGDHSYVADSGYIEKYLGLNVKVYYKINNGFDDDRTVGLIIVNDYDDIVDADIRDVENLDSSYRLNIWREDGSRFDSYTLDRGVIFIKNGVVEPSGHKDIIDGLNYGSVRLVDADENGVYEYCIIKDYVPFVMGYSSTEKGMIFDKLGGGSYALGNYKYARVYDSEYNEISVYNLDENAVLSIARSSAENEYIELIYTNKTLSGMIEQITEEDGKTYVTINSEKYSVNPQFLLKNTLNAGELGSFRLDMFETIVAFDEGTMEEKYGLLVGTALDGVFAKTMKLKIFGSDGQMYYYDTADRLTVDEETYTDMEKVNKCLVNAETGRVNVQVINYDLNDEGKISVVDTVALGEKENKSSTLRDAVPVDDSPGSVGARIYTGKTGRRIGMSTYINTSTICFATPSEEALKKGNYTDDDFSIATFTQMKEGLTIVSRAYYSSYPSTVAKAIIGYDFQFGKGIDHAQDIFVVSEVYEEMDADGDVKNVLEGFDGNTANKSKYIVADNVSVNDIAVGDAILLLLDNQGKVSAVTMIYDNSLGGEPNTQKGSTWYNKNRYINNVSSLMSTQWSFSFMYAGYKDGDFISGFYDKDGSCYANDEAGDLTYCKVIVVDNATKGDIDVRIGDVGDILDAHTVGNENCSRLLVNYVSAYMRCIVVYL